jgi:hypothetical protein
MGVIKHDAVIVTVSAHMLDRPDMPDVDAFRASMPEEFRPLVVGPIPTVVNGDVTYVFAPDGSKEGWGASVDGDQLRAEFIDLFSFCHEDGSSPFAVVAVRYGGDQAYERGAVVTYQQPLFVVDSPGELVEQ